MGEMPEVEHIEADQDRRNPDAGDPVQGHRVGGGRDGDFVASMLREAAAEIEQGLVVLDAALNIVYANPQYHALMNLPVDTSLTREGEPFEAVLRHLAGTGDLGPGDPEKAIQERMTPLRARRSYDVDRQLANGRFLHVSGIALRNGGYAFTFTDITRRVTEQNRLDALVRLQTRELQEANQKLTDGIEYARLIQSGIMPQDSFFDDHLGGHYLLFRPVDIVGGDFYLGVATDFGIYVGIGDCTGHGIPGAMMTMMAASVCRRAINDAGAGGPSAVMMAVDRIVRANLHQTEANVGPDNGLELTLCLIEPEFKRVRLASAGLESFVQSKGVIERVRGSKLGLGYGRQATSASTIQETVFTAKQAERIFLCSDGILDQSGGEKGFGFGRRRLMDALQAHVGSSIVEQGQGLDDALIAYSRGYDQRDDLTVFGFCPHRL